MLARVTTFAIDGIASRRITVEVDVRRGLPAFTIVGRGDAAVRESRERVQTALPNAGFGFPQRRITVNLAPAQMPKIGPGFDLATACGVLVASGQLPAGQLARWAVFGELSLGGELRRCRGVLAVAEGARGAGIEGLVVPRECAREAALVDGLRVAGAATLGDVAALLRGQPPPPLPPFAEPPAAPAGEALDLADVRGHRPAVSALTFAAAGAHNILLSGPPGVGKTMLARRAPSILPPLTRAEAIAVTRVHSVAGTRSHDGLVRERPFRAPHHTISVAGLIGGGAPPRPGEASLADHGVLFLDELSEFSRPALEALRQPLEDGAVTIARGRHAVTFPTRFQLVAATNPCPCGRAGERRCRCSEADHARHRRKLSGPLLDRVDMLVHMPRPSPEEIESDAGVSSAAALARVLAARERQARRLEGRGPTTNAELPARLLAELVRADAGAEETLRRAYARGEVSARGRARVLRVARTIADVEDSDRVRARHVGAALGFRQEEALDGRQAA